jgi:uncharacterized protein (TIGR03067 family)
VENLPARPDLDYLRRQAKALLTQLKKGDDDATRAFVEHLPAARTMNPADLAGLRLADAQSVIARKHGFASWAALARHIGLLRDLEGSWRIAELEIDGQSVPAAMSVETRILIDGDRFRTESPEGTYEGVFSIDAEVTPPHFTIQFVAGPEAGGSSLGIYRIDGPDQLTLCLGLAGASRPTSFATRAGSGHALERLSRVSRARPANVDGGTAPTAIATEQSPPVDPSGFDVAMTPLLERLQGTWRAIELIVGGKSLPAAWLANASRTMIGNELTVEVGGQVVVHARVRIDESATPIAVDYLNLLPQKKGKVTYGIMEWIGDDARFLMAPDERAPRPTSFDSPGTLSTWTLRSFAHQSRRT